MQKPRKEAEAGAPALLRDVRSPAAWHCQPGAKKNPVCALPQRVQNGIDNVTTIVGIAKFAEMKVAFGLAHLVQDNVLLPEGMTAQQVAKLEKASPGISTLLRLPTAGSPVAGLATNVPIDVREKVAKRLLGAVGDHYAAVYRGLGLEVAALKTKEDLEKPYVPRGSIAYALRKLWQNLSGS